MDSSRRDELAEGRRDSGDQVFHLCVTTLDEYSDRCSALAVFLIQDDESFGNSAAP